MKGLERKFQNKRNNFFSRQSERTTINFVSVNIGMSKSIASFTLRSSSIPSSFEITEEYAEAAKLNLSSLKPDLSLEKELVETADAILEAKAWREQAATDANNANNNANIQQQNTTNTVQFAINDETKSTEGNRDNDNNNTNTNQTTNVSSEGNYNNTDTTNQNLVINNDGANNDTTNTAAAPPTATTEVKGVESTDTAANTAAPVSKIAGATSDISPLPSNTPSAEATPRLPLPGGQPISNNNVNTTTTNNPTTTTAADASSTNQPAVQQPVPEERPGIESVPGINSRLYPNSTTTTTTTDAQSIETALKESKVTSIMERTHESRDTCIFYLEMMDWDVEKSLEMWQQMTT